MWTTIRELKPGDTFYHKGQMYEAGNKIYEEGMSSHTEVILIDDGRKNFSNPAYLAQLPNLAKVWKVDMDFDVGIL
jgi:hypothetical protein